MGRLDEQVGLAIGHRPCARRFTPARTRADLAADIDQLRAPSKANHRHAEILACMTGDLEPQSYVVTFSDVIMENRLRRSAAGAANLLLYNKHYGLFVE